MNITCSRVVYISIVIIFGLLLLLLSKTYWHVVQSLNDLYCVCSAVVPFDNTNNTNPFYSFVAVLPSFLTSFQH